MENESIIYFAKEWNQDRTSCDHVFEQLAKSNKVLWVNSITARKPNLASAHDWKRIVSKLRKCLGGLKQVGLTAWVYQPIVIPLPHSKIAQRLNRRLLRWSLRRQARQLEMTHPQLWTFLPTALYIVGQLDESLVVYYCIDAWSEFSFIEGPKTAAMERELVGKADICFATAHSLADNLRPYNANTHVALHGVDYQHFAKALAPDTPVPDDVAHLPKPIVGFFGMIHDWIDLPLVATVARKHPEWSIVLIGKTQVDTNPVKDRPNVHLLGRRPYESLPGYCKAFSAGIIPFVLNELTRHVNPIKLREYLSAGLPVVSTDLPEVAAYRDAVFVAHSADQFVEQLELALRDDSPALHEQRSQAMQSETWESKVAQLWTLVEKVAAEKSRKGTS
jgi:glycosyltransferase involved in cell wall biosynthesis